MATVAFIGLGVMGYPMAGHLAKAGHTVRVYNRTSAKAQKWVSEHDGSSNSSHPSPRAAAEGAEAVFMCVGNDDDVRAVTFGPGGALEAMGANTVLVDHTTASADVARELHAAAAAAHVGFVDAPVSGGQAGAQNGTLTIMCGGVHTDYEAIVPLISAYARMHRLLGGPGSGQLTKMVNQICIAGLVQSLAEGIDFGRRAGLDVNAVLDVISKGAAQSWQMENRGPTMVRGEFEFGFAVEWMRKDLGICLDEARRVGARLPIAALVDQFYGAIIGRGGARWDTSSLVQLLAEP